MKLNIVSKQALTVGQYLYETTDTDLTKFSAKFDYVLFGSISESGKISNIGAIPSSTQNVVVSLISGKVYNEKSEIVAHTQSQSIWNKYKKDHGPINSKLETQIINLQAIAIKSLQKVKFGEFNLDEISKKALEAGQFIYTTDQTVFIDSKSIPDYLCFVEIDNNSSISTIGLSPTDKRANGLVSFVSGNLFNKSTILIPEKDPKSISSGYSELLSYQNQFGGINQSDLEKIKESKEQYIKEKADNKKSIKQVKPESVKVIKISDANMSNPSEISLGSIHISLSNQASGSISNLQESAAGKFGIQLTH